MNPHQRHHHYRHCLGFGGTRSQPGPGARAARRHSPTSEKQLGRTVLIKDPGWNITSLRQPLAIHAGDGLIVSMITYLLTSPLPLKVDPSCQQDLVKVIPLISSFVFCCFRLDKKTLMHAQCKGYCEHLVCHLVSMMGTRPDISRI